MYILHYIYIYTTDSLDVWNLDLKPENFAADCDLVKDLHKYKNSFGGDGLVHLEIRFPTAYPLEPPFFRVITPRFKWHTGHVSVGGSICLEVLVNTQTDTGYKSTYTMEALITMVVFNLTVDNPPAAVSQGRIDFELMFSADHPKTSYGLEDAKQHFNRIIGQHGWINWNADGSKPPVYVPPPVPVLPAPTTSSSASASACASTSTFLSSSPQTVYANSNTKPPCRYAPGCYRKNPQHWEEFSHPGQHEPAPAPGWVWGLINN